jgi:hypothetical protein
MPIDSYGSSPQNPYLNPTPEMEPMCLHMQEEPDKCANTRRAPVLTFAQTKLQQT